MVDAASPRMDSVILTASLPPSLRLPARRMRMRSRLCFTSNYLLYPHTRELSSCFLSLASLVAGSLGLGLVHHFDSAPGSTPRWSLMRRLGG